MQNKLSTNYTGFCFEDEITLYSQRGNLESRYSFYLKN